VGGKTSWSSHVTRREKNVALTWGVGALGGVRLWERGGWKNVVVESRNSKGEERRVDLGCRCLRGSEAMGKRWVEKRRGRVT